MANKYKVHFQITFYEVEEGFNTTEAIKDELKDRVFTVTGGEISKEDDGYTVDDFVCVEIEAIKTKKGEEETSLVDIAQDVLGCVDNSNPWFSITDSEDNLVYSYDED